MRVGEERLLAQRMRLPVIVRRGGSETEPRPRRRGRKRRRLRERRLCVGVLGRGGVVWTATEEFVSIRDRLLQFDRLSISDLSQPGAGVRARDAYRFLSRFP